MHWLENFLVDAGVSSALWLVLPYGGPWVLDWSSLGFVLYSLISSLGQFSVIGDINRGLVKMASSLFYFML